MQKLCARTITSNLHVIGINGVFYFQYVENEDNDLKQMLEMVKLREKRLTCDFKHFSRRIFLY